MTDPLPEIIIGEQPFDGSRAHTLDLAFNPRERETAIWMSGNEEGQSSWQAGIVLSYADARAVAMNILEMTKPA